MGVHAATGLHVLETFPAPIIRVAKQSTFQASWREDVAEGANHPLEIEKEEWVLIWLLSIRVHHAGQTNFRSNLDDQWTEDEKIIIEEHLKQPKIDWALDNSFDGLYFHRQDDNFQLCTYYRIGAYLKSKHATFWKLKYG